MTVMNSMAIRVYGENGHNYFRSKQNRPQLDFEQNGGHRGGEGGTRRPESTAVSAMTVYVRTVQGHNYMTKEKWSRGTKALGVHREIGHDYIGHNDTGPQLDEEKKNGAGGTRRSESTARTARIAAQARSPMRYRTVAASRIALVQGTVPQYCTVPPQYCIVPQYCMAPQC